MEDIADALDHYCDKCHPVARFKPGGTEASRFDTEDKHTQSDNITLGAMCVQALTVAEDEAAWHSPGSGRIKNDLLMLLLE